MMARPLIRTALALALAASQASAQPPQQGRGTPSTAREDALDPTPIDPARDPDTAMFLNDWRNSKPRTAYGRLVFRDILTRLGSADPVRPVARGAVLTGITAVSQATLAPGAIATGRAPAGERQIFYTSGGTGQLTVNGKAHEIKEGVGFILTPGFDFRLATTGKAPLAFYVRSEPIPAGEALAADVAVTSRWDNDRRIGAHWMHICNGGPAGMNLCTIAPYTMPQPHSHAFEEVWLAVKGETVLTLGKTLVKMRPGQAYKIPPTGLAAHSNANFGNEPVELIYMGPAARGPQGPQADFARLDNSPIAPGTGPDVDMFMGSWRDAYPRIAHGNLYMRDMLTALKGRDPLSPERKGAVLEHAEAVSHAMLEPGSTAHPVESDAKNVQETFVVASGTGYIVSGDKRVGLTKGMAFILAPGMDFKLTATGNEYLTFYVVTEKAAPGTTPRRELAVIDRRAAPPLVRNWVDSERPVVTRADGLVQYGAITHVSQRPMAMDRPYSAAKGAEEVWIALDDVEMLFGKQLRRLPAGTAYKIPATGITARANINLSDKPAEFLTFAK